MARSPGSSCPATPSRATSTARSTTRAMRSTKPGSWGAAVSVKVPFGTYKDTLLTDETAPKLDPGVHEHKYYVAGVGDIKEQTVAGNHEQIQLVRITH